jgi:hypothetical protein
VEVDIGTPPRTERAKALDLRLAADGAKFRAGEGTHGMNLRFVQADYRGDDAHRGLFSCTWVLSGRTLENHGFVTDADGYEKKMTKDSENTVLRTLQLKFTLPTADLRQFLGFIKATEPYYELFGGKQVRLLQNVDNPAQFVQIVDYEIHQSFETSRQQIASDPRLQAFLQGWRQMFPGTVEVDVFREVES